MENIEVIVQVEGDTRTEIVIVPEDATVDDVVRAAAQKALPVPADGGLVFVEEGEEPVDGKSSVKSIGIRKHGRVHISRCRKIAVTVNFKELTKEHHFSPATTVKTVRAWALHEFIKDKNDQVDHALQLCGTDVRPELTTQLGALVKDPGCKVCFDLVPIQRVEG